MKISKETLALLKNFATINGNLLIKPGNVLLTKSADNGIYASVKVAETFETEFGVYDLNELLGIFSLFENPHIEIEGESHAIIKEGRRRIRFNSASESVLTYPSKEIKLPVGDIAFKLSADDINMIVRTAAALRAPDVAFKGENGELKVIVYDKTNSGSNSNEMDIGEVDETFSAIVKVEKIKMIPGPYDVEISAKKALKFSSGDLMYVLALEKDSTFDY